MTVTYSFTFEYASAAPFTVKGCVEGTKVWTLFHRAAEEAMQTHSGTSWTSLVCLIDRGDDLKEPDHAPASSTSS